MVIALPDRGRANVPTTAPKAAPPKYTPPTPVYNGKTGGTAKALIGLYQNKCTNCDKWQAQNRTTCEQCGATFTAFIEKD